MSFDLFDLLETRSFDALNEAERNFVLSQMTAEEYQFQHEIVTAAATEEPPLVPNDTILPTALAALKKNKKPNRFIGLFSHRVPTWSVAAIGLLLLGLVQFNFSESTNSSTTKISAPLAHVDTVFIEKEVPVRELVQLPADTVYKTIYRTAQDHVLHSTPAEPVAEPNHSGSFLDVIIQNEQQNYALVSLDGVLPKGVSVKDDTLIEIANSAVY